MKKDDLYNIALQCAKLNGNGCACGCEQCQYNVFNYVSDVREASLLKANAYSDYHKRNLITQEYENNKNSQFLAAIIWIVLIAVLVIWAGSSLKQCINPDLNPQQEVSGAITQLFLRDPGQPLGTLHEELTYFRDNPNNIYNIPRILLVMRTFGVYDINEDGKIDCIDHSLIFRILYGSNARIMVNKNPTNKFNHMFIRVRYANGVMDIEPQGTPTRYAMGVWWGVKYDREYNRDVTDQWTHYVEGM